MQKGHKLAKTTLCGVELTFLQAGFVKAITDFSNQQTYGNALQSARAAGYRGNDNTVGQRGNELVNNSKIQQAIAAYQAEIEGAINIRQAEVIRLLRQYAGLDPGKPIVENRDRLKSIELLGKTLTMFGERSETTHKIPGYTPPSRKEAVEYSRQRLALLEKGK